MRPSGLLTLFAAVALVTVPVDATEESDTGSVAHWPQWRGPLATGVAPDSSPPVEWSETRNIAFKVAIPGQAASTPIIWGDRIFLTSAVPTGETVDADSVAEPSSSGGFRHPAVSKATEVHRYVVMALDRTSGEVLWKKVLHEELPHEGTHELGSFASPSPVTDGEHLIVSFGSRGIYGMTLDGEVSWKKDLGDLVIRLGFGEGTSPVLYRDRVLLIWDHEGDSFATALDKATGRQLWRTDRDDITSWATPLVVEHSGQAQLVTSATGKVRSYSVDDGALRWETTGMTLNTIPAPVAADGVVYVMSGFRGNALLAIDLERARGDLEEEKAVVWSLDRDTPYTPSPVLDGDRLLFLKGNGGVLSMHDARTGERLQQKRLADLANVYPSPIAAGGRLYVSDREGTTAVVAINDELEVLAVNELDGGSVASMAVAGDDLFVRSRDHLYRISER